MQKRVKVGLLKEDKRVFLNYPLFSFYFFPYLVSSDYSVIAGPKLPNEGEVNVIVISDIKKEIEFILSYQKDLLGRNIGFDDKLFFIYNFLQEFEFFYKVLEFPENKVEIIRYFCSLDKDNLVGILKKGITSLREAEYFFLIREDLKKLLIKSNISKQDFKIALNICFEITKNKLALKEGDYTNIFELLLETRYPLFSEYRKKVDLLLSGVKKKNLKLEFDRFFEGRKLRIEIEVQTVQDFLNVLNTLENNRENIVELVKILNS